MTFDPWTATSADALLAYQTCTNGKEAFDPTNQIFQVFAVEAINLMKPEIENGNGFAVLSCIRQCVTHGLVAPEWLAYAFNIRFEAISKYNANSWDDPLAFGKPNNKGTNIKAKQKEQKRAIDVYKAIFEKLRCAPETPIDKALFEEIGKPLGLGATLTEEYFYKCINEKKYPHPKHLLNTANF